MDKRFQRTFDQVTMPDDCADRIQQALLLRRTAPPLEELDMKKRKTTRKPVFTMAAAIGLIAALSVIALAAAGYTRQQQLMLGGEITQSVSEDGSNATEGVLDTDALGADMVEVRDGKLYFIADGQNIDLTDQCSDETPYIYNTTDGDGAVHYLVVGGTAEDYGVAEFIQDTDGSWSGGASYNTTDQTGDTCAWLQKAGETLGLPCVWSGAADQTVSDSDENPTTSSASEGVEESSDGAE